MKKTCLTLALFALLTSCSDDSADRDGDGVVSNSERAAELASDGLISMKPGRWQTQFTFTDIDVPALGKKEKQRIMAEVEKGASSDSCLSVEEAKHPGADFFGGEGSDDCTYSKFDLSGRNARMTLTCSMSGMGSIDMDLKGSLNEDDFAFDAGVVMRLPMVGKVKLKGTAVGRHVGTCESPAS